MSRKDDRAPVEVWGGLECTVNRVQDRYFDQCQRNGHCARTEDLERFAWLGIKALRYPVLWENTAPDGVETADWTWADLRLPRLRTFGVRPIVGLVHHGSGPRHTSLIDPSFPSGLARFARAVAERFPWLTDFTPVNEPLTTARFSGLYGHWYPHGKDGTTFTKTLLTQCRAVVESMRAIREVIPHARLVQTDDIGRTFGTPKLQYQVDFENERRWLSFDLLCGRVSRDHPFWPRLLSCGAREADLEFFLEHPTPPDVLGLNYYLTSDRVLDEKMENYPPWSHGGNDQDRYADVEAVRVRAEGITGHERLLQAAWDRYRLPVSFTEVHLGCTREEQLRWLLEAWVAANNVHARGADVRAITVWSLLGAYDWNTLVTADRGFYEPGTFDLRGGTPRPTAIAHMTRALATEGRYDHPVLASPGWWRRPMRMWKPHGPAAAESARTPHLEGLKARRLLIVGATGTLGCAIARICEIRGLAHHLLCRKDMDIASRQSVEAALERFQPWAVVNAAGYVKVDQAEMDAERCFRENTLGPAVLAAACRSNGVKLVTFSSDLVFDGGRRSPYQESHGTGPLNIYGQSKADAEGFVVKALPSALVVRTGAFFGPWDVHNFVHHAVCAAKHGARFRAANDLTVSPTYVPDLVEATLDLLVDGEHGIWHLTNDGEVTWFELARRSVALAKLDADRIEACPFEAFRLPAPRPAYSALGSERGRLLPPLDEALERYVVERDVPTLPPEPAEERPHEEGANDARDGHRRRRLHR